MEVRKTKQLKNKIADENRPGSSPRTGPECEINGSMIIIITVTLNWDRCLIVPPWRYKIRSGPPGEDNDQEVMNYGIVSLIDHNVGVRLLLTFSDPPAPQGVATRDLAKAEVVRCIPSFDSLGRMNLPWLIFRSGQNNLLFEMWNSICPFVTLITILVPQKHTFICSPPSSVLRLTGCWPLKEDLSGLD